MKIEYKNRDRKKFEDIYQVGNVIIHIGYPCLVTKMDFNNGYTKYFLVSLQDGDVDSGMYDSLKELAREAGSDNDVLVKAKLTVDYKLDGDEEDEDVE